jgi:hypothetical protein
VHHEVLHKRQDRGRAEEGSEGEKGNKKKGDGTATTSTNRFKIEIWKWENKERAI